MFYVYVHVLLCYVLCVSVFAILFLPLFLFFSFFFLSLSLFSSLLLSRLAFHSSDNGAIHLVLLQVIGFYSTHDCFDLYHTLNAPTSNLQPYFKFVSCTRYLQGPSRRWRVRQGAVAGTITVWNRWHGWAIDGFMVHHRTGEDDMEEQEHNG